MTDLYVADRDFAEQEPLLLQISHSLTYAAIHGVMIVGNLALEIIILVTTVEHGFESIYIL